MDRPGQQVGSQKSPCTPESSSSSDDHAASSKQQANRKFPLHNERGEKRAISNTIGYGGSIHTEKLCQMSKKPTKLLAKGLRWVRTRRVPRMIKVFVALRE